MLDPMFDSNAIRYEFLMEKIRDVFYSQTPLNSLTDLKVVFDAFDNECAKTENTEHIKSIMSNKFGVDINP